MRPRRLANVCDGFTERQPSPEYYPVTAEAPPPLRSGPGCSGRTAAPICRKMCACFRGGSMRVITTTLAASLIAVPLYAQSPPAAAPSQTPTSGAVLVRLAQGAWANAKRDIIESADQMPEANYAFKPVDSVRTFGQIVAHVADSNNYYCARSKGEAPPIPDGTLE